MFISILLGCAGTTRLIEVKEPPCVVPGWPEFPVIKLLKVCPDGAVCISNGDYVRVVGYLDQVGRMKGFLDMCPQVVFMGPPAPTPEAHVSP